MSRGFRIAELARRSDTPKETIHYYLRIGLLRKPKKTSKNMAYYDDGHVEQLKLIKRLRTDSYLPLSVIQQVMRDGKLEESTRRLDLAGDLFGEGAKAEFEQLTAETLAERVGVSTAQIGDYERAGLLLPKLDGGDKHFGWEDLRVAELLANAEREAGEGVHDFLLERFQLIEGHVTALVREESAHFFASLVATSDPKRAMELLRGGRETVGRYLAIARVRRLRYEIEALLREVEGALQDTRPDARPSPEELPRPAEAIAKLAALAEAHEARPSHVAGAIELFELLAAQGGEAEIAERYARLKPKAAVEPRVLLCAGEAGIDLGRYDDSLEWLRTAREGLGADAMLELLVASATLGRLRDRLLATAGDGATATSGEVIGDLVNGLHHLQEARKLPRPEPAYRGVRFRLLLGRVETAMPAFLGRGSSGRKELRGVIDDVARLRAEGRDPGLGILTRLEWNAARSLARRAKREEERAEMAQRAQRIEAGAS